MSRLILWDYCQEAECGCPIYIERGKKPEKLFYTCDCLKLSERPQYTEKDDIDGEEP